MCVCALCSLRVKAYFRLLESRGQQQISIHTQRWLKLMWILSFIRFFWKFVYFNLYTLTLTHFVRVHFRSHFILFSFSFVSLSFARRVCMFISFFVVARERQTVIVCVRAYLSHRQILPATVHIYTLTSCDETGGHH